MRDIDLTRLQETGSALLPRASETLASLLEGVEQLGIDPSLVTVTGAGAALWLRVQPLEDKP